jgi:cobalt/nickel transport system permease protein
MGERAVLLAYAAAVVAITSVHSPVALAAALALALPLGGRDAPRLLRRALTAVALVAGAVSLAYVLLALLGGEWSGRYLLLLNLRVLLLTYLTLLLAARVDLLRASAFSPTLGYLLTLAYSQSLTLRRGLTDFRQALASRSIGSIPLRARYRHSAAAAAWLLDTSERRAREVSQAMRSRGFFHD